jgi:CelD/BcsL family acetyltransferase involved in cellulose biosynthesis
VVLADPRTDPRWIALAASQQASLFTSPPWIRSVCDTYGFTPRARIVTDAAGLPTDGFAWVPISDIRGDRLVSLPFSDRAEPILSDPAMWSILVDDALCSDASITVRCFDGAAPTTDARLVPSAEAAWHGTPLAASVPEIHRSLTSAARRDSAAAERKGVHVDAVGGIEGIRTYHRLHVMLRKYKHRQLAQPLALFERIWQEFSASDSIVTFLAHADGEPIAGAVCLAWNDVLYYKFAASLGSAVRLLPNDAVAWAAIRWAAERGFRLLDWGLSDLEPPGLVAYKRKWASDERRIVTVRSQSVSPTNGQNPSQLLGDLTRLFTDDAVPDHITARAGSLLYRYFA